MPAADATMLPAPFARVAMAAVLILFGAAVMWGGSARTDVAVVLPLRLVALAVLATGLAIPGATKLWRATPVLLITLLAGLMLVQLVPLPPAIWRNLPGRLLSASISDATGLAQVWRPLTLTPDLTLNSLLSLLPPTAALVCLYRLAPEQRCFLLPTIAGVALVSALVGVWQLATDGARGSYLYAPAHFGWPTGVFANRNHQAALLASALPAIAAWATLAGVRRHQCPLRTIACLAVAVLCIGMIVAAGSRAGLLLGAIAVAGSLAILAITAKSTPRRSRISVSAMVVTSMVVLVVAGVALSGRNAAFSRLAAVDLAEEQRVTNTPLVVVTTREYFPVGSGFGSFDPVFRIHEPDTSLQRTYYNHAHNDFLELALTGGLPALILLGFLAAWLARRFWAIDGQQQPTVARGAALAIVLILIASIVDYPLRTPLIAIIFSGLCSLLDFFLHPRTVNQR